MKRVRVWRSKVLGVVMNCQLSLAGAIGRVRTQHQQQTTPNPTIAVDPNDSLISSPHDKINLLKKEKAIGQTNRT